MTELKTKEQFIELRANNVSYDKITKQLGISKPTLIKWARELETDITNMRTINLEALQEQYKIGKLHKLEMWSEQLQAIRKELNSRGYKDVPTTTLIDLLERFTDWLDNEKGRLMLVGEPRVVDAFKDLSVSTERDRWAA